MSVESNRRHFVAGLYTAYSDVVGKRLGMSESFLAPFLIHNLDPLKAGIAGCLISFTAQKCHRFIISWLPKSAQDSIIFHATTHFYSYLAVGAAFGAASALLLPAAGITAATGVALGFSAFAGTCLDRSVNLLNVSEFALKNAPSLNHLPISTKTLVINSVATPFFLVFSDMLIKCFISPQSLLGHLLLHHVQNVAGSFLLGCVMSISTLITYNALSKKLSAPYDTSKFIHFLTWVASHIIVGAALGLMGHLPFYLGIFFMPILLLSGSLNLTTGVALGIASLAGSALTYLIHKVIKIFYAETALHLNIQIINNVNEDLISNINENGNMSHQAAFYHQALYKPQFNHYDIANILSIAKKNNTQEMSEEDFKNWQSANSFFWESVTTGELSPLLNSKKPTEENFAAIYHILTKTELIPGVLVFEYKDGYINFSDNMFYKGIYDDLKDDELKNNPEFNIKALAVIGNRHWEVMPETMKTDEDFLVEGAFKNRRFLFGIDSQTLGNILPAFIGHRKFLPNKEFFPDLFKLSAKAYNFKEEDLIRGSKTFLLCIEVLNKKAGDKRTPRPIQNKIVTYIALPKTKSYFVRDMAILLIWLKRKNIKVPKPLLKIIFDLILPQNNALLNN